VCFLLDAQVEPSIFWGRLRWPKAAIPCIVLLLGLPWSVADAVRGKTRGSWVAIAIGAVAALLNLGIGLDVIFCRVK